MYTYQIYQLKLLKKWTLGLAQQLAHQGRIDQDRIRTPNSLMPTDVGLNTPAHRGLDIWRVNNIRWGSNIENNELGWTDSNTIIKK